ncbi:hypothetical protein Sjap_011192 [Stephania japonica]|uniref:Expansin-like EG45 domain-containing protein n=1 Tax=Stephania japonica TaxID=461633 RepID=A0AAP0P769_9MAGN
MTVCLATVSPSVHHEFNRLSNGTSIFFPFVISAHLRTSPSSTPAHCDQSLPIVFRQHVISLPNLTATRCNGGDQNQFPEGGMFGAVSNGLWDNGAACGRRYRIRCISELGRPCMDGSIVVTVVDSCCTNPCTSNLVLSNKAFDAISRNPATKINIEYTQ